MRQDPVRLLPADPRWPDEFADQTPNLATVLGPWLVRPIEHIGSTSIPGLPAKPIIDMLAVVTDYEEVGAASSALAAIGWVIAPEPGEAAHRKHSYCHPSVEWRTHHLHVVEESSTGWPRWLAFRDHLRANPDLAAEYARVKLSLAERPDIERTTYRSGKAPFINGVLHDLGYD